MVVAFASLSGGCLTSIVIGEPEADGDDGLGGADGGGAEIGDGDGDGDGEGNGGGGSSGFSTVGVTIGSGAGGAPATCDGCTGVAMFGPLPPSDMVTTGGSADPTSLHVFIGSGPPTCAEPYEWCTSPHADPSEEGIVLHLVLPPEVQVPGTYSFAELAFDACYVSDGSDTFVDEGTVEIVEINDAALLLRLDGGMPWVDGLPAEHVVARCAGDGG